MVAARWALLVPLLLVSFVAAGCGDDAGAVASADGTSGETDSSSGDTDDSPVPPPPIVIDTPDAAARGARLYVVLEDPVSVVDITLGDLPLPPDLLLRADNPAALYLVPADAPLGPTTLTVARREDPRSATVVPLRVVDPMFADVTDTVGLAQTHDAADHPVECADSHTGIAVGDYDNDGAPDLFVGNVGSRGTLHRNLGDPDGDGLPTFEDVTTALGLDTGPQVSMATFIDLEGDGDLDLFVGRRGHNRVYENALVPEGTVRFDDVTAQLGLDQHDQRTMGVAFGDYDGDDDLDLYVVNHAYCFPQPQFEIRSEDHLYRNDNGVFVEVTSLLDPEVVAPIGFSAAWVDIERDGDVDLLVINDDVGGEIGDPNVLWRNDGPGEEGSAVSWRFTDRSLVSGVAVPGVNGMGLGLGDVDRDGFVDLSFSNIGANYLLLNRGDGTFEDVSQAAGVQRTLLPWSRRSITWATHLWDHDNDGDLDLYFSGGRIKGEAWIVDAMLVNDGTGQFVEQTWAAGLTDPNSGKASALLDLDRDGSWEFATTAWAAPLKLYQNRSPHLAAAPAHWLDVELLGRGGNRAAIGAIVELRTAGGTQTCFHSGQPSLGAGGEPTCHFGLGPDTVVEALSITWPDGQISTPTVDGVDRRLLVVQAD